MSHATRSPEDLSAKQILDIPRSEPERLFPRDAVAAKAAFRHLAGRWHPDRCAEPRAVEVFQHLRELHKSAEARRRSGLWRRPGQLDIRALDGRSYKLRHLRRHGFELGELYVCRRSLAFVIDKAHEDLFANAERRIARFPFAGPEMRREAARYLPHPRRTVETAAARILLLDKPEELVLLKDLVAHLGGRLEGRHAAWVISSLLSLACYLDYAGLVHGAIAPDSVFVSPRGHWAALLGGWWYALPGGARFVALPQRSSDLIDARSLALRTAEPRTDLVLIRALGREILGDPAGARLTAEGRVPPAIANWLRMPSSGSAVDDYRSWQEALSAGYGARRFVELAVTPSDVYG